MCPGTISGAPGTNEPPRLLQEPPVESARADAFDGIFFLVAVLAACVLGILFLSRPLTEAIADVLSALGHRTLGPSDVIPGTWREHLTLHPGSRIASLVGIQLVFPLVAVIGALLLGGGVRRNLGLLRPRGGWRVIAAAVALEVLLLTCGINLAASVMPADFEVPEAFKGLQLALATASTGWWVALLAAHSVVPGFGEELLFRGLVQRRLLATWGPAAAVLVTGLVFLLLHPPLMRMLALVPVGLLLGFVAWRCDSIFPGMALHIGANASILALATLYGASPESPPMSPTDRLLTAAIALVSGAIAVWLLRLVYRWTAPPPAEATGRSAS